MATISLVMIVKDEEDVLERCVDSVKDIIDEFIIVDTGSTDNTKKIIEKYGKLYEDPWISDVENKQLAIKRATCDYIILMDADEYFDCDINILKEYSNRNVEAVYGWIEEGDPVSSTYARIRLFRNSGSWIYSGPGMHGCIHTIDNKIGTYDRQIIVKHEHNASKKRTEDYYENTYNEYIDKISKHLETHPNDIRGWFYLARSLRDIGSYHRAVWTYKKYLSFTNNSFIEERWQAYMDMGKLHIVFGEYEKAFYCYNKAMHEDHRRNEHFIDMGIMYYNMQDWDKAIQNFEAALKVPFPEDVVLFINPQDYHITVHDYISICYSRKDRYDKAIDSTKYILNKITNDSPIYERISNNLSYYQSKVHLKIFMVLGYTAEDIYGGVLTERGVHGIETTYIELSSELSKLGHDVYLFCRCDQEHTYDNVKYIPNERFKEYVDYNPDMVISTRDITVFDMLPASKKILWIQDCFPDCLNDLTVFSKIDLCICSSNWHKNLMHQRVGHGLKGIKILPLGIRKDLYQDYNISAKEEYKVIYSSSPDRGLVELIDMWDKIVERVPKINLTVCYGLESMKACSIQSVGDRYKNYLKFKDDLLEKIKKYNINFAGRLTKEELAKEMLSSELCLYPVNFYETYCITAIECQAAGVPLITSPIAALKDTVDERFNILIEGHPHDPGYTEKFIAKTEHLLLKNRALLKKMSKDCHDNIINDKSDWSDVALLWQNTMWELL